MAKYMKTEDGYVERTHWEEVGDDIVLLPEITLDFTATGPSGGKWGIIDFEFEDGKTYKVKWDDIVYKCVAQSSGVGNRNIIDFDSDSNEPFWIGAYSGVSIMTSEVGTHTVSISTLGSIIHRLDEKYLPEFICESLDDLYNINIDLYNRIGETQTVASTALTNANTAHTLAVAAQADAKMQSDWNQTDETSVDYIRNKTHYTETVIHPLDTTIDGIRSYNDLKNINDYALWNALKYHCDSCQFKIITNEYESQIIPDISGKLDNNPAYRFLLNRNDLMNISLDRNVSVVRIQSQSNGSQYFDFSTFTLRITGEYDEEVVHKLDPKYIPINDSLSFSGMAADAKAVGDALATKITAPATAIVGQTIVVKSVDGSGKPTEWEATDFSIETITLDEIDEICGFVTEGALLETDVDELMAQLED